MQRSFWPPELPLSLAITSHGNRPMLQFAPPRIWCAPGIVPTTSRSPIHCPTAGPTSPYRGGRGVQGRGGGPGGKAPPPPAQMKSTATPWGGWGLDTHPPRITKTPTHPPVPNTKRIPGWPWRGVVPRRRGEGGWAVQCQGPRGGGRGRIVREHSAAVVGTDGGMQVRRGVPGWGSENGGLMHGSCARGRNSTV